MKFNDGDHVKILPHLWWPEGGTGRVSIPPDFISEAIYSGDTFDTTQRTLIGNNRLITEIWVSFDTPIMDISDDGPYVAGEVSMEYLELL